MDGRITIDTDTATSATGEALFPLLIVGRLKEEVGGWGYNIYIFKIESIREIT